MENKLCDICGAAGFVESLATCSRCEQACEHIYCMRINLQRVPEVWFCEACSLQRDSPITDRRGEEGSNLTIGPLCGLQPQGSKAKNDPVKVDFPLQKSIAQFPRNSDLKGVETGKVKHIPAEEVIKLTFGAKKTGIGLYSQSAASDSMTNIYKRTPPLSTTAPSKCFLRKQNAAPMKRALPTQQTCCSRPPNPKPSLAEKLELHKVDGKEALVEAYERPSCASSPCMESLSTRNSAGASLIHLQERRSVKEKDLPVFSPRFEYDHVNLPALKCTWKGSFEIINMSSHSQFYDGFRAHPPGKVSRKAYEFSMKMPGILQFKLQNHSDLWAEVFDSYSPAGNDIALYFLPGDFERSIQMYKNLYKHLEMNDFAVRGCLEGVELLIFTSEKLPLDSGINKEFYLWGVFRCVKGNNVLHHNLANVPVSTSLFLPGQESDYHSLKYYSKDNPEVLDMDIDMTVGKYVGRVDVRLNPADVPVSSSLILSGQGNTSHLLKYDSKDNPEVVDMEIDMIGGKEVGRVDVVTSRLLLGDRPRLNISQGADVQFQLQSQPPVFTYSNVICKSIDGSCKGSGTSGVRGHGDYVVGPPLNVIPCPCPSRPNKMDKSPQHFLGVKRETYPAVPPGFSRRVISWTGSDKLLKKPQPEEPIVSENVNILTPLVGKDGRLPRQLVKEGNHGGSLQTSKAFPPLKREDRKDLDAPPGFS